MNVSRTSWHYRVLHFFDLLSNYGQESLCVYFWKVVFAVIGIPIVTALALVFVTVPFWWWLHPDAFAPAVTVGTIEIALLLVVWYQYRETLRERGDLPTKATKDPSIVVAWLVAKHRRVCPLITFN